MIDITESIQFFMGAISCIGVGLLSSYFSGMLKNGYFRINGAISGGDFVSPSAWYTALKKPSGWPPNFLFGPIWFSLYVTMGIGSILIIKSFGFISIRFGLFSAQLLLNFFWSIIFFNFNKIKDALILLYVLDGIYGLMLISVLIGFEIDPQTLKTASAIGCFFMLFVPILFFRIIKNLISSSSTIGPRVKNILPWFIIGVIEFAFIFLLFLIKLPYQYSRLGNININIFNININPSIFIMLLPTMVWISFATYLNYKIKKLNP